MFGSKDNNQIAHGRGGATLLVYNKFVSGDVTEKDWFGTVCGLCTQPIMKNLMNWVWELTAKVLPPVFFKPW